MLNLDVPMAAILPENNTNVVGNEIAFESSSPSTKSGHGTTLNLDISDVLTGAINNDIIFDCSQVAASQSYSQDNDLFPSYHTMDESLLESSLRPADDEAQSFDQLLNEDRANIAISIESDLENINYLNTSCGPIEGQLHTNDQLSDAKSQSMSTIRSKGS
ncbi:unnamed protein product [Acanthoscelides obtectus]|uniref:Uncharacterized protein n=1 Tax=Acanthoscelides obtectus TaxID=200917 RepID=A0A9P0L340_ACAOB|nr:unnamed protein product [Acanthoscelides obtectus]CAK1671520.1 hypothetical protein AOBTE_LOCUS28290 [Acanthoscelides obtectus]